MARIAGAVLGMLILAHATAAQFVQQGSKLVGADTNAFTTPPLVSPASFWVRVTNACGTADSATATIAVERGVRLRLHRSI